MKKICECKDCKHAKDHGDLPKCARIKSRQPVKYYDDRCGKFSDSQ